MKVFIKFISITLLISLSGFYFAQDPMDWSKIKLDPIKEKKFFPYVAYKHSFGEGFQTWKNNNKFQYIKEMWYYTESFYVKRNVYNEGEILNEEIIDISRFESNRKNGEEAIVSLPGFKDVIVLLPKEKLIYQP